MTNHTAGQFNFSLSQNTICEKFSERTEQDKMENVMNGCIETDGSYDVQNTLEREIKTLKEEHQKYKKSAIETVDNLQFSYRAQLHLRLVEIQGLKSEIQTLMCTMNAVTKKYEEEKSSLLKQLEKIQNHFWDQLDLHKMDRMKIEAELKKITDELIKERLQRSSPLEVKEESEADFVAQLKTRVEKVEADLKNSQDQPNTEHVQCQSGQTPPQQVTWQLQDTCGKSQDCVNMNDDGAKTTDIEHLLKKRNKTKWWKKLFHQGEDKTQETSQGTLSST